MRHTLKVSYRRAAGIGLAAILLAATAVGALANVGLTSFDAVAGPRAAEITVRWTTETEVDAIAFRVVRSTQPLVQTATEVATLPALGSGTGGASYEYIDTGLVPGQRYYYWLYEFTSSGSFYLLTQAATAVAPVQSTLSLRRFFPLAFRSN